MKLTTNRHATMSLVSCILMTIAFGTANHLCAQEQAPVGSIAELLQIDSTATLKPWVTEQVSSGQIDYPWDYGVFRRTEPGRRYVILDQKGRGAVDRIQMTYRKGDPNEVNFDLLIYIDGEEEPTIKVDLNDFFNGKHKPFVAPLTGRCGFGKENLNRHGSFSYTPIGFEKSCKMVIVRPDSDDKYEWRNPPDPYGKRPMFFYQVNYRLCEPSVPVKTFAWKLDAKEEAALEKVAELWDNSGRSPWPPLQASGDQSASKTATVGAGAGAPLLVLQEPGTLREILIQVKPKEDTVDVRKALVESLWLDMTWDDAEEPQVSAPLSIFFMAPDDKVNMTGFWLGCKDRRYYCYLPMPFFKNAKIAVRTKEEAPADTKIVATFRWTPGTPEANETLFHVNRYDYPTTPDGTRHVMALDTTGRGHVVGIAADRRAHCEDDDCWFFDGEETPSVLGTGAEDFFNFSWGLGDLQALPMHGMRSPFGDPAKRGYRDDYSPLAYRFHTPAGYPFKKSLKLSVLRDRPKGESKRYAGTIYYYKRAATSE